MLARALYSISAISLAIVTMTGVASASDDPNILDVGIPQAFLGLDPHGSISAERPVQLVATQVFDTLVRLDGSDFVGSLAQEWTNPDPLTWVFTMREGVSFHDGSAFTSEDAKASIERLIELKGALSPLMADIESVEATDPATLTIRTKVPSGALLPSLAMVFIGPAGQMDDDAFWRKPAGTGPFMVDSVTSGESISFIANEAYFGGAPEVERLNFRYFPEIVSRLTALETGELDLTWNIAPDQVGSIRDVPGIVYATAPSRAYYFNWFNASAEPFDDPLVRRAMWHAVDIETIVGDLFGDLASVAKAPIPNGVFGWAEQQPYDYNPEKAREMLAEAGYPDGFKASIQWNYECCPNIREIAYSMISDWAEIGVTIEPLEKQRAEWQADFRALNWHMNLQTNSVLTGDADYTLGRLYVCSANRNGYCNPELDEILAAARAELDIVKRRELYRQAGKVIWEDAVGIFPMDISVNAAWRDVVTGFAPPPNDLPRFVEVGKSG